MCLQDKEQEKKQIVEEVVTEINPIEIEMRENSDATFEPVGKEFVEYRKDDPYIKELPKKIPIKVIQLQQLFHPGVQVFIKPSNHKLYWEGEAIYIPVSFYNCDIKDISFMQKRSKEDLFDCGSVTIFIDKIELWEELADKNELDEINKYYK